MKDFNIMEGSLKNPIFKGGFPKNQTEGELQIEGGAWTVSRFKGGLVKKRGCCLPEGGVDALKYIYHHTPPPKK